MLEEPSELIAHVRLCGEDDRVTGRLYPEQGQFFNAQNRPIEKNRLFAKPLKNKTLKPPPAKPPAAADPEFPGC